MAMALLTMLKTIDFLRLFLASVTDQMCCNLIPLCHYSAVIGVVDDDVDDYEEKTFIFCHR